MRSRELWSFSSQMVWFFKDSQAYKPCKEAVFRLELTDYFCIFFSLCSQSWIIDIFSVLQSSIHCLYSSSTLPQLILNTQSYSLCAQYVPSSSANNYFLDMSFSSINTQLLLNYCFKASITASFSRLPQSASSTIMSCLALWPFSYDLNHSLAPSNSTIRSFFYRSLSLNTLTLPSLALTNSRRPWFYFSNDPRRNCSSQASFSRSCCSISTDFSPFLPLSCSNDQYFFQISAQFLSDLVSQSSVWSSLVRSFWQSILGERQLKGELACCLGLKLSYDQFFLWVLSIRLSLKCCYSLRLVQELN